MNVLVTGSSGRIGRALCHRLAQEHSLVGLDAVAAATTDVVADITDAAALRAALRGVDAVVHAAALHAPQVGHATEAAFAAVNVDATRALAELAAEAGAGRFVFTSTTALYGAASTPPGRAGWVDEDLAPRPRTVYHRTKLAAEAELEAAAARCRLAVTVLRMSRCFPQPAPAMAVYRLHRGIDARDVADAHAAALRQPARPGIRRYIVSGATPFHAADAEALAQRAGPVLAARVPALVEAFARRGWPLPGAIDRVYVPSLAMRDLGWTPRFGWDEVLRQLDAGSLEVTA